MAGDNLLHLIPHTSHKEQTYTPFSNNIELGASALLALRVCYKFSSLEAEEYHFTIMRVSVGRLILFI